MLLRNQVREHDIVGAVVARSQLHSELMANITDFLEAFSLTLHLLSGVCEAEEE